MNSDISMRKTGVKMRITVLMSTYNGGKYLSKQLESILNQSGVKLNIIIRDDGSTDNTKQILNQYSSKYDNFTVLYGKNIGASKSFLYLINHFTDSDYFALSDQDDVWDKDKLSIAINELKKLDNKKPNLYYSNLRVCDKKLNFVRNSHKKPHISDNRYSCLLESLATGCTIVYNRRLAELMKTVHLKDYTMHDIWLYQTATLLGEIIYDFTPHISYRVHDDNEIGTFLKRPGIKKILKELKNDLTNRQVLTKNAQILMNYLKDYLSPIDTQEINKVINYKKSLKSKLILLNDKKLLSNSNLTNFRLRVKIITGIL